MLYSIKFRDLQTQMQQVTKQNKNARVMAAIRAPPSLTMITVVIDKHIIVRIALIEQHYT